MNSVIKRTIIVAMLAALLPIGAGAQALRGSYFMDNSVNRNKMNPAFAPRSSYFQIPAIGNMSAGAVSNMGMSTFLYPSGEELLTFLHKDVSVEHFDKALAKYPRIDVDAYTNVLNFGFYNKHKAFWTFDLSVRAGVDVDVPRDLFMFVKKGTGTSGQRFNIANAHAYASASVQAALGWSRNVSEGVRIGVKARFIAPVAYAALNLDNVLLTTSEEKWTVETKGSLYGAMHGLELSLPEGEKIPQVGFDLERMLANKVLAGYGGSVDLGIEWQIVKKGFFKGLQLSAAVTDLGVISYMPEALTSYSTAGKLEWSGFQDVSMDNADFQAAFDDFLEEAEGELLNFKEEDVDGGLVRSSMPSVYAGVEIPILWNRVSFGLLYSGRFSHSYYRQEVMASCNLMPVKWLALGVNYSICNTRDTFGWLIEFTPKAGINLCLGCDYLPYKWTPAPILESDVLTHLPTALAANVHFGLSLALGSKYGR